MRSLHEYLYYLVYDHPGESLLNTCNETEATVTSYRNDIIHGEKAELPKVYFPSVGWKMFVPPLPKYPSKNQKILFIKFKYITFYFNSNNLFITRHNNINIKLFILVIFRYFLFKIVV